MVRLRLYRQMNNVFAICAVMLLLPACTNIHKKEKSENALQVVYMDAAQQIVTADALAGWFSKDRLSYEKTFRDSSIFIMGNIQRIDEAHGEVLLRNDSDKDIVCLMKDSTNLPLLRRADNVIFKGICKTGPGYGVVLIGQCEVARMRP